ncbi:MAG: metallophosphoesterase [Microthrixaceae bacterium]|nr:metallophosphoesterase [Microthrixaceae bacterium]
MRHRTHLEVFAIEDTSAQLVWRGLRPGLLSIASTHGPTISFEVDFDAGAGGTVIHGLPPGTDVLLQISGSALGTSADLSLRTLDRLPGQELSRIGTVSDLHLGARSFGHRGTIVEDPLPPVPHPQRCTAAAIDGATRWGAQLVVAKGDLTHNGQVDQWRQYAEVAATSSVPVVAVPGNHDRAFRTGLSPEDAAVSFGFHLASPLEVIDGDGYRLVLVDSTTGGHNHGGLVNVVDDALDAVRSTPGGSIALIFMHHQLHRYPLQEVWPVGVGRRASVRFLERLARTGVPAVVSSGHTHRHRHWDRRGVVATQVGSTKDYPGVWAGYVISEGGMRQVVHRVTDPDCIRWTETTRRAAAGAWRWIAPGSLGSRCFDKTWPPAV